MQYRSEYDVIYCTRVHLDDLPSLLATIHDVVDKRGYSTVRLDFTECSFIYPAAVLALCSVSSKLRSSNIDTYLILPKNEKRRKLFLNCNWAHLLDPKNYEFSKFKGYKQVPATQYKNSKEQDDVVKKIVTTILAGVPDLERGDFGALEWAINELTDNVLTHSSSIVGGFVQVSILNTGKVLFAVADSGIGIPETIKYAYPGKTDFEAIELAIQEGVTRDKNLGQGNGLFGSYQICSASGGLFEIFSNYGRLSSSNGELNLKNVSIPYEGTLVVAEIDFLQPNLLEKALSFKSGLHKPLDYIEMHYEEWNTELDVVIFKIKEESDSCGSRVAGTPVRMRLIQVARMCPKAKVNIDFSGIEIISSSFADEVIAKLYCEVGPMTFMSRFVFVSTSEVVKNLIDKAIMQRVSSS